MTSSLKFPCKVCEKKIVMNNNEPAIQCDFSMCVSNFHNNNKLVTTLSNESSLLLKPIENLKLLVNQFNNASPKDNIGLENVI